MISQRGLARVGVGFLSLSSVTVARVISSRAGATLEEGGTSNK